MEISSNRNSVASVTMATYFIGAVAAAIGIYIASITRINLLTNQTSNPYLVPGIIIAVIGVGAVITAQRAAKRSLRK